MTFCFYYVKADLRDKSIKIIYLLNEAGTKNVLDLHY